MKMLDFVYFVWMISKYYIKLSKFSTIFHRETSQMPTPLTPQRPYNVSRGQNRYVTLPLGEM